MVHRVMTSALAALGVIALVASGQFSRWVSIAILIGLVVALSLRETWQRHSALRHVDTVALLIVLVIQVVRIVLDANVLDVLVEFAAALQIIRLATRKGAAHDQQVIVLALLHLIAGTVLGGGLGYGLCFVGVLVVAPGALVLSHLRREVEGNYRQGARDRTGLPVDVPRILRSRRVVGRSFLAVTCLLSIPIFVFTAVLFVVFPRVGLSLLLLNRGHAGRMIGFSGRVDLGEVGVLRSDPTIAMRVEVPNLPEPPPIRLTLHLRGTALDAYDGRAWSQSVTDKRPADNDNGEIYIERGINEDKGPVMRIDLEPIDPPVLFLPEYATGIRLRSRGQLGQDLSAAAYHGPEGEFRYNPVDDRGLKYDVFLSRVRAQTFKRRLAPAERARYLTVTADLPERVRTLAQEWTRSATTPLERTNAILKHLRTEYRYDLASPSGRSKQPLDDFLFESKRGHCEFYSTAMAIMLRTVGVPTRNVTGFVGGTYNRFGRFYAVRQGDAHSWVEVYLDEEGWRTFDPTPPSDADPKSEIEGTWATVRDFIEATSQRWDRHVVGYDRHQQVGVWESFSSRIRKDGVVRSWGVRSNTTLLVGLGLVAVGGALFWVRRRHRRRTERPRPAGDRSQSSILATALYEQLESAMGAHGVARSPGTPPLRHAEALSSNAHPLGPEILELTRIYLRARFGGIPIEEDERRDFERRVRTVKLTDAKSLRQASGEAAP